MKNFLFRSLILGAASLALLGVAFAEDTTASDLEQLRRLQKLADEQVEKARKAKAADEVPTVTIPDRPRRKLIPSTEKKAQDASAGQAVKLRGTLPPGVQLPMETDEEKIDRMAFDQMLTQLFPLTPEQIVVLRKKFNETELAKTIASAVPPKPTATSQFVNLAPGSNPPVIRLSKGFVTSLVFLDSTGAEWPIEAYDLGDPRTFNIQWDRTSNVIMIQAMKQYNYGNIAVRLRGLNTPVMITLIPGQRAVDYRVDMRVQGYGPNALVPTGDLMPPLMHKELLALLDGVPPVNARELQVSDSVAQAWLRGPTLFLRTRHQMISPGWLATLRSADGMHVYQLAKTPLVLVTQNGKIIRIKIEGL